MKANGASIVPCLKICYSKCVRRLNIIKARKTIRVNKGVSQEQLGESLGVSGQAVSKWENESALPDIMFLPKMAEYFGISIDELMGYKLNALTYKEQFVKFMLGNGILKNR